MPSGTEPLYCRVAAGALPGLPGPLTRSHLVGPVSAAPPGDAIRHGAAFMPGGGWRLTRPTVRVMFSLSLSPPGRGIASGAGAVQPRHLLRAQAQRRRAGKTLHLSHAGGAGDRRGHPFAADQPREGHFRRLRPCSSATAAVVSIIRIPRGFRYLPILPPRWLCARSDG